MVKWVLHRAIHKIELLAATKRAIENERAKVAGCQGRFPQLDDQVERLSGEVSAFWTAIPP
jgi:hypothetical protein